MIRRRIPAVTVVAVGALAVAASADAKVRHHYRHALVRAVPPLARSASPIPPRLDGYASGVFEAGIPSASSADPYAYQPAFRPGYGYIPPRYVVGPGVVDPGY